MPLFATDTSYYQPPLTDAYPHQAVIFRHSDGSWPDPIAERNLTAANRLVDAGRLKVVVIYHVFRPGLASVETQRAAAVAGFANRVHAGRGVVMIDAETWGGQISGNHSAALNALRTQMIARLNGNPRRVWGYANRGDWASMWPTRPVDLPMMVASYGSQQPTWAGPQMLGWQYTDGGAGNPVPAGWPRASAPFGACDHNAFPAFATGDALAAYLFGGNTATTTPTATTPATAKDQPMTPAESRAFASLVNAVHEQTRIVQVMQRRRPPAPGDVLPALAAGKVEPAWKYDLLPGQRLLPGGVLWSRQGRYKVMLQTDGNLVVYSVGGAVWSMWRTLGRNVRATALTYQADGNVVATDANGKPVWNTGTAGKPAGRLIMQDDGNLVVYSPTARPQFNTGPAK